MKIAVGIAFAALVLGGHSAALAQIAVAANDGKQLRPGEAPSTRTPDYVSVIDLRDRRPKEIGSVRAPASMIGAPTAVAVARDASFALVTALQRVNAAGELEPIGVVSVIDLATPSAPKVVQTLEVSPGAGGITINRAGTLAMVSSNSDDTVAVFSIAGKRLTPAGKIQLPKGTRPTDVVFAPDGRSALVVGQGAGKLIRLTVDGDKVAVGDLAVEVGVQPYGAVFSPDGRFVYNTNLGGRARPAGETPPPGPRIGTVSAVDLATGAVASVEVGQTPELVAMAPDGRHLAVVIHNGATGSPTAPGYNPFGLLKVLRLNGTQMTPVAEAQTSPWCQGAVFTPDGGSILLQCALTKEIEVYRFDGRALTRDPAATLTFTARPGAIATAVSR